MRLKSVVLLHCGANIDDDKIRRQNEKEKKLNLNAFLYSTKKIVKTHRSVSFDRIYRAFCHLCET